ncbi:MAG: cobalamin-dependent protein, partial [Anaerolineae bacterium]
MSPRLLLINPTMKTNGRRLPNAGGMATMEPLALAYVAALTPPHWQVRIVDEVLEEIPEDSAWSRPDLVGLTSLTITAPRVYEIAQRYRAQGAPVVLGGVHATLRPDEAARYVDVVFQGEAEGKWPMLIRDFEAGRLKSRYNGEAAALRNLPLPRRDLYRRRYFLQLISASRGCRYRCEFCTLWKLEGGRYRARPVHEVLDELETMGGKQPILFTDENAFTDREWALALFRRMAERGLDRPYAIQASLDITGEVG